MPMHPRMLGVGGKILWVGRGGGEKIKGGEKPLALLRPVDVWEFAPWLGGIPWPRVPITMNLIFYSINFLDLWEINASLYNIINNA